MLLTAASRQITGSPLADIRRLLEALDGAPYQGPEPGGVPLRPLARQRLSILGEGVERSVRKLRWGRGELLSRQLAAG